LILVVIISYVSWLVTIVVFLCVSVVSNSVSRADSFSIAMRSWLS
jgi:hypothetical protein